MKHFLTATLLLLFTACTSIPEDNSMAPVVAELYSAELHSSCGSDVGILGCHLEGELEDKFLSFPLIYKGNFEIVSKRCNFKMKKSFQKSGWFKISWAELVKEMPEGNYACIFNVRVKTSGIRSRIGQFMLMDSEEFGVAKFSLFERQNQGVSWLQYKKGTLGDVSLKIQNEGVESLEILGCGIDEVIPGNAVKINDLGLADTTCAFEVAGIGDDDTVIGTFILRQYSDKFVDLPDPHFEYRKGKLYVVADRIVGIVSIGDKYRKSYKMVRKVKKDQEILVRILTSNGRFKLYKVKNGEVIWKSSIR